MSNADKKPGSMKPPTVNADAGSEILKRRNQPLEVFFSPHTAAVIGASETPGSVGRTVLWNLISNPFGGTVFPVNSRRSSVLGIKAYPNIAAVPEPVDLALIVTRSTDCHFRALY